MAVPQRPRSSATEVASLPRRGAPGGGPGYHLVVSARGTGARSLGTFTVVKNATLIVQIACSGPPPLTLQPLFDTGPCNDGQTVTIDQTQAAATKLTLRVIAPAKLVWAIYVVQPDR
jgi:hypothetical protein